MKNFTKDDLRTGHIIVTKYEDNAILIGNVFKSSDDIHKKAGLANINSYKDNLTHIRFQSFDIEQVYEIVDGYGYNLKEIVDELPSTNVKLVWERKRKIDWNKIPQFTKVEVRDDDEQVWTKAYFIKYNNNHNVHNALYPYRVTLCDKFTYDMNDASHCDYNQIRIFDPTEIKEEWYK